MSGTIFDFIDVEEPSGQKGYIEIAKDYPKIKKKSLLHKASEYGKSALKGGIEGLINLGYVMSGPTGYGALEAKERLPENLDELIPTEEEGYIQRSIRRGLSETPTMLALPGSGPAIAGKALASGFLGEGAKELGLPKWAEPIAELLAYLGPDVGKKLLSTGTNKEIIDAGRKFGLTDAQITPLIQSEFKQKILSKISPKRGATQKALSSTKEALSHSYGNLQTSEEATKLLSPSAESTLRERFSDLLFKMPSKVRKQVKEDLSDLLKNPISGETLINFYSDVNHSLGPKYKQLSLLKPAIREALGSVSPELAKDFDLINKLHTKYYPIASRLKPTLTSDLISGVENLSAFGAFVTGSYPVLVPVAGKKIANKLAQQMLINPRFQQLPEKILDSVKKNKFQIAKKTMDLLAREVGKTSPEVSKKLEEISEEDLMDLLRVIK